MPKPSRYSRTEEITEQARDLRGEVSKTEGKLWPRLCKGRMGASFRKQHPIGPFFADYCCVSLKLVVEVDGPLHDMGRDEARDRFMAERGLDVTAQVMRQDADFHRDLERDELAAFVETGHARVFPFRSTALGERCPHIMLDREHP